MKMQKAITVLIIFILLSSCKEERENFVFILVDDLGWTDPGYAGSSFYETPHIDALCNESIQFTHAYASGSVCSPSRAAILSGKHPARLHITDWIPGSRPVDRRLTGPTILNELPLVEITLAEALKQEGYSTFYAGKWHLGDKGFFPEDQGFESNYGGHHRGSPPGGYYSPYKNPKLSDGAEGEYLTDRLTDESIRFLDSIEKPFFLYLAYYSVHTPIEANRQYIEKFKTKLEGMEGAEIAHRDEGEGVTTLEQSDPAYASMLYALDANVGRIVAKLKKEGLYESTNIVFTSDNGGLSTLMKDWERLAPTSVLPLRAGKGWLYEGGIRIPLLIKPSNYSGEARICNEPVIGHDFYPTILSMAGIVPDSVQHIDGLDLCPLLEDPEAALDRQELFWHYPHYHGSAWTPGAAILRGDWKLIEFYESNTIELYNLSEDISETSNLALVYPEKADSLLNRLHALQKSTQAHHASINPDY